MKPHHRPCSPRAAALGLLACAALAAPAVADSPAANSLQQPSPAMIGDTPADYPGASRSPVVPVPVSGDTPADYPGMPGAPAARGHARAAAGFDWPSAAIGAAVAGLIIVLAVGGASVLTHRRPRAAR